MRSHALLDEKGKHMDALIAVFGSGQDLDSLQMAARAAVAFIGALVCIRISGRRSFGQRSPFDYVVAILLGATLSRVIVGASPAIPTMAASTRSRWPLRSSRGPIYSKRRGSN
jgi:hypothetical protein